MSVHAPPASHRLGDLAIDGLDRLPDRGRGIDLYDFGRCSELRFLDLGTNEQGATILLRLVAAEGRELSLLLKGVSSFHLPETSPHLWLSELAIIDIKDRGLEGIRFLVQDQTGLQGHCASIECIEYEGSRGEEVPEPPWTAKLDSRTLAALVVDALIFPNIVKQADVVRAIAIATEEIEVRKIIGDY